MLETVNDLLNGLLNTIVIDLIQEVALPWLNL